MSIDATPNASYPAAVSSLREAGRRLRDAATLIDAVTVLRRTDKAVEVNLTVARNKVAAALRDIEAADFKLHP